MEKVSEIIVTILISAFIGLSIGGFTSYIYAGNIYPGIFQGLVLGALIGICSRYIFKLIYARFRKKFLFALLSVLGLIALMTGVGCALWHVPFPSPYIYILLISLIMGVVSTVFIFRNIQKLNEKLRQKQRELENGR